MLDGLLRHLALAAVGEETRRLVEREPPRLRDLVPEGLGDVAEPPALVADEEERDDLEDPLAVPGVDVLDVAELAERAPACAGLLGHLPQGGLLRRLAGVDPALRQRPQPFR